MRAYQHTDAIINPQRTCTMRVTAVIFSVCLSETDFEDGFVLSHQSMAGDCLKVLNETLFEIDPNSEKKNKQ